MPRSYIGDFRSHLKKAEKGDFFDLRRKSFSPDISFSSRLRLLGKAIDLIDPFKSTEVNNFSQGLVTPAERFLIRANSSKILKELQSVISHIQGKDSELLSECRLQAVVIGQKLAVSLQLEAKRDKAAKVLEILHRKLRPQRELGALLFAHRAMVAIASSDYEKAKQLFQKSSQTLRGLKTADLNSKCLDKIFKFISSEALEQLSGRPLLIGNWDQRDQFLVLIRELKCELSQKYEYLSKTNRSSDSSSVWALKAAALRVDCGESHDFKACIDNLKASKSYSSFQLRLLDIARCQYEGDFQTKQEGYFRRIELRLGEEINLINHEGKDIRERLKYQTLIAQLYSRFPQALDAENLNIAFELIEKKNMLVARQYLQTTKTFISGREALTRDHAILIARYNLFRAHTEHDVVFSLVKLGRGITEDSSAEEILNVLELIYTKSEIEALVGDPDVLDWGFDSNRLYDRICEEIQIRWAEADGHYKVFFSCVEGIIQKYWLDISDQELEWVKADWKKLHSDWPDFRVIQRLDYPINALQLRVILGTNRDVSITPEPINYLSFIAGGS